MFRIERQRRVEILDRMIDIAAEVPQRAAIDVRLQVLWIELDDLTEIDDRAVALLGYNEDLRAGLIGSLDRRIEPDRLAIIRGRGIQRSLPVVRITAPEHDVREVRAGKSSGCD